jgi:hypothetical protein
MLIGDDQALYCVQATDRQSVCCRQDLDAGNQGFEWVFARAFARKIGARFAA